MLETAPVFCDPESQICYYIFTDFIRNGYAENYENKRAVYLDEGIWKEIDLARKATIFSDPENFTVTFSDPEGNELSEDRYESAEDTYFAGCEKEILRLNWNMTDTESFAQMSREELRGALENVSFFEPAESE